MSREAFNLRKLLTSVGRALFSARNIEFLVKFPNCGIFLFYVYMYIYYVYVYMMFRIFRIFNGLLETKSVKRFILTE